MKILKPFLLSFAFITGIFLAINKTPVQAQTTTPVEFSGDSIDDLEAIEATLAAEASEGASLASQSAKVDDKIKEKIDKDITETSGEQKSVLITHLDENPIGALSWKNPIQKAIRKAVAAGMPANIIVLLLMFPIIASIVAFSRHIVGLKGFGIYIPAVLSVAFVSTGIVTGVIVFIAVLISAIITRKIVTRFKLPMLPRTAMLLFGVSTAMLALLLIGSVYNIDLIINISIFPLLIIILLTENFMETQLFSSQKEAFQITFETLAVAVLCSFIVGSEEIQKFIILRPELILIGVALVNLAIGKYTGLRILEYFRFRNLILDQNSFANFKDAGANDAPEQEE
jgi:hypothetical protein